MTFRKKRTACRRLYPDLSGSAVSWPHPCAGEDHCKAVAHIADALLWQDLIASQQNARSDLLYASSLMTKTAHKMDEANVLSDLFGISQIALHPADLDLMAGLIAGIVALSDVATHDDTAFFVKASLDDDCPKRTALLNAYFGVVQSPKHPTR